MQPYEEDCLAGNVNDSYVKLATYLKGHMHGFKCLCLNICIEEAYYMISVFGCLLESGSVSIVVRMQYGKFQTKIFKCKESFLGSFERVGT